MSRQKLNEKKKELDRAYKQLQFVELAEPHSSYARDLRGNIEVLEKDIRALKRNKK